MGIHKPEEYAEADEAKLDRFRDQALRERYHRMVMEEMDAAVFLTADKRMLEGKLADVVLQRNEHAAKLSKARLKLFWLWKSLKERKHPEFRKAAVSDMLALVDDLGRYLGESVLPEPDDNVVQVNMRCDTDVSTGLKKVTKAVRTLGRAMKRGAGKKGGAR